jgi:pilus assembly protein Flp/PilA
MHAPGLNRPIGMIGSRLEQRTMKDRIAAFVRDETGTAAIEYGLVAALIAVPLISAAKSAGLAINATFNTITEAMK